MDILDIRETSVWRLFEKGRNYHRLTKIYTDTDRNYRMYNGNQWEGADLGGAEPVQKNFIKPIVKYKLGVIHDNLYAIHYSSQNFESMEFQTEAERYCEMLNRYARRVWENDKMDFKGRRVTKDSAINDEGIIYVDFNQELKVPVNEIVKKSDIYYGNENDDDIQNQPYILIRKRMPVANARIFAKNKGLSEEDTRFIIGDNDVFEESGEAAKEEVDDQVTIVTKFYKQDGVVHYAIATRYIDIVEDTPMGIKLYPIAQIVWEEKEGSARGEGEVRYLIPNQIEVNKTEVRRVLTVKTQAFPQKVVDGARIKNKNALNTVGAVIETNGQTVDDVRKVITTLQPAQMSPDVKQLQEDLIQVTRELAGAGDIATGEINPESASGRAILAVQQASQSPMTEQKESYKNFIEDLARIWLDYLTVASVDGVNLEEELTGQNGEKTIQLVNVPQTVLEQLKAVVSIDVTPKGAFDKYAQEQSLENLLKGGYFTTQRIGELKRYVRLLDDDSVMPKAKLELLIKEFDEEQMRIMQMQAQAQAMQQRAMQYLNADPNVQAHQMADAQMQMQAQQTQPM